MALRETVCCGRWRMRGDIVKAGADGTAPGLYLADPPDADAALLGGSREPRAGRKEVVDPEGGQRPRGIADESLALGAQGAHEEQLAPLQRGDREAVRQL